MGAVLRAGAGILLGTVVFTGLLALLARVNFTRRLEDAHVYKAAVSDTGVYGRIYDEVLGDAALRDRTAGPCLNREVTN